MNADSVTAGRRMERLSNSSDTRDFTDLRVTIPQDSAGVRHKGMRTSSPDPKKGALPANTAQKRIADDNQKAGPSHRIEAMDTESARRPNLIYHSDSPMEKRMKMMEDQMVKMTEMTQTHMAQMTELTSNLFQSVQQMLTASIPALPAISHSGTPMNKTMKK